MEKIKVTLLALILIFLGIGISTSIKAIDINAQIFLKTQYPWNKKVPMVVAVKSPIDAQKLEVSFEPTQLGEISPQKHVINNIKANVQYNFNFTFNPQSVGNGQLVTNVVIITQDNLYTQTYTKDIKVDANRVVYPKSTSYTILVIGYFLIILAILSLIGFGIFKLFIYIKHDFLPKWMKEEAETPI